MAIRETGLASGPTIDWPIAGLPAGLRFGIGDADAHGVTVVSPEDDPELADMLARTLGSSPAWRLDSASMHRASPVSVTLFLNKVGRIVVGDRPNVKELKTLTVSLVGDADVDADFTRLARDLSILFQEAMEDVVFQAAVESNKFGFKLTGRKIEQAGPAGGVRRTFEPLELTLDLEDRHIAEDFRSLKVVAAVDDFLSRLTDSAENIARYTGVVRLLSRAKRLLEEGDTTFLEFKSSLEEPLRLLETLKADGNSDEIDAHKLEIGKINGLADAHYRIFDIARDVLASAQCSQVVGELSPATGSFMPSPISTAFAGVEGAASSRETASPSLFTKASFFERKVVTKSRRFYQYPLVLEDALGHKHMFNPAVVFDPLVPDGLLTDPSIKGHIDRERLNAALRHLIFDVILRDQDLRRFVDQPFSFRFDICWMPEIDDKGMCTPKRPYIRGFSSATSISMAQRDEDGNILRNPDGSHKQRVIEFATLSPKEAEGVVLSSAFEEGAKALVDALGGKDVQVEWVRFDTSVS